MIVDDVISSGGSILTAHQLLDKVGAKTIKQLAILAEGDAADRDDIHFLGKLPLF